MAFVSNNGWVDGNTADGIRKTLVDEFTQIWVYNLRGNARTSGDTRKREGGGVFGLGARTGVAILIAAKRPPWRRCRGARSPRTRPATGSTSAMSSSTHSLHCPMTRLLTSPATAAVWKPPEMHGATTSAGARSSRTCVA